MDAFEIRMVLVGHLRKLNATSYSVNKVVNCMNENADKCAGDLWKCLLSECKKGSLNHRLNILYMLDDLLSNIKNKDSPYLHYIHQSLSDFIFLVVPDDRNGLMNVLSTLQILESWKLKRLLDFDMINALQKQLVERRDKLREMPVNDQGKKLSTKDILKRFEEDRERHKRLREQIWVLPISNDDTQNRNVGMNFTPKSVTSPSTQLNKLSYDSNCLSLSNSTDKHFEVEFENAWDQTSDWNSDDEDEVRECSNMINNCKNVIQW